MAGFQTGGDVWVHLLQGIRAGAEGKVGIYNNRFKVQSDITASPPLTNGAADEFPRSPEIYRNNQFAFISEASADIVFDVLPSWSVRAGYEVLFLNSIALAGENFNPVQPYGLTGGGAPTRVPIIAEQGNAFYHGFHAGFEYIW